MPYKLTWEPAGVYREYFGDLTASEHRKSFDIICGDQRFDGLLYAITNYLAVQNFLITKDDMVEFAALHIGPVRTNPRFVIAAVADKPEIVESIEHFKSLRLTTTPYRTFSTVADARSWIESGPR